MDVQVTAIYASILGILLVLLAFRVVSLRRSERVGIGFGESKPLRRAIRVHGNATEYVPTMLFLLLVLELNGGTNAILHGFGITMVVARILHAWGLSRKITVSFGRFLGTFITYMIILSLAVVNLVYVFS